METAEEALRKKVLNEIERPEFHRSALPYPGCFLLEEEGKEGEQVKVFNLSDEDLK